MSEEFRVGHYDIKMQIHSRSGAVRQFTISSERDYITGHSPVCLFDYIEGDIANLRKMIKDSDMFGK